MSGRTSFSRPNKRSPNFTKSASDIDLPALVTHALEPGSWTTLQENIAGTGGVVQVTDAGAAPQSRRFYRLVTP